jgi:hypothetical protein
MKKLFYLVLIVAGGLAVWVAFALWTGIYAFYTIPPGETAHIDGATILVSREEFEPMFMSPNYRAPKVESNKGKGIGFGSMPKPKRPIEKRTIVELPYIDWAYKKALQMQAEAGLP